MSSLWRRLSISAKLTALLALFAFAFLAFFWNANRTIETLKVNGPVYARIVQSKDVIADVLPPPEYIIEAYLVVLQLESESDPREVGALLDRSHKLRKEFEDRHAFWKGDLSEGRLKETLLADSYGPAREFFEIRDKELIPAVRSGNRAKVAELARGRLRSLYEDHRRAIDSVVSQSTVLFQEEEKQAHEAVMAARTRLFALGGAVVFVVLLMGIAGARFGGSLSRRIEEATSAAKAVASGDLTVTVKGGDMQDEGGQLLGAVESMARSLSGLVSRMQQSSMSLLSTANEIGSTSQQQESTVQGFGASTAQIAAAVKQISATAQELASTMGQVSGVAAQASKLAENGRGSLEGMDRTMQQLTSATGSISGKLAVIREKATDINEVVTTITKVADQTNLLSVNAAIEAEKAGEHGLGFLVLAREIRRLADQTAVATLDIDRMVREMQSSVSSGVMEMDKFSEEVRRGVDSVHQMGSHLGAIIEQVDTISERFETVNEGMRSQSQGAAQIDQAMVGLVEGVRQTAGSLREFNGATDNLRRAASSLKEEISQFRLAS